MRTHTHTHTQTHTVFWMGVGEGEDDLKEQAVITDKGGTEFQQLTEMLGRVVQTTVGYHSHIFKGRLSYVYIYGLKVKFSCWQK